MKQQLQKFAQKIDALTLRERIIIFVMLAVFLISVLNVAFLDRQFARQKQLSVQVSAQRAQISQIQAEIQRAVSTKNDPDQANRARLQALKQQSTQMEAMLMDMQKGLVSSDKMTVLLEDILRRDGKLRLVSLKTLPPTSLVESTGAEAKPAQNKPANAPAGTAHNIGVTPTTLDSVYKHGVEIVLQGRYFDIVEYMAALEAMPWQLFWGKAKLHVDEHPTATLSLTLFTMSLDKRWVNL